MIGQNRHGISKEDLKKCGRRDVRWLETLMARQRKSERKMQEFGESIGYFGISNGWGLRGAKESWKLGTFSLGRDDGLHYWDTDRMSVLCIFPVFV